MKKYNIQNYVRYKEDLKASIKLIPFKEWVDYTDDELKILFLPLVENIGRKFATSQQASGVLDIVDIIQCGSIGLCKAVEKLDRETLSQSEDQEKTLKSFLAKRIRGTIRRAIDINRADMRIPEHKLNEIRKNDKDKNQLEMFFNSVFVSLDKMLDDAGIGFEVPDKIKSYNPELLCAFLLNLLDQHLTAKESEVIKFSFGLNCDKLSAKEIAAKLGIKGDSAYVRVSQLKKQAIDKLIDNVDYSQVVDFL